jgi:hypothetical protein
LNLTGVDTCHSDFSGYVSALHRADHAIGHLWDYIQTQIPGMAGNTTIIAIPECGRNDEPNSILDVNGWRAYDHSDANSLRIFSFVAGPDVTGNQVIGSQGSPFGKVSDAMLTAAEILGVDPTILTQSGFLAPGTQSWVPQL